MHQNSDSDDDMNEFMEKFKTQKYKNAFNENNWQEEFDKIPMFMKSAPEEINPEKHPELACIQSIIHDDDRPPEEQAQSLKDEGNEYFKEKNYHKAVLSYTAALKKNCKDSEMNAVLYTNRAAAQFHLGNMRSSLNDASAALKLKPDHIKAMIRGAHCCLELRNHADTIRWCDEGLKIHPTDNKLQELRATADKLKRAADRDARKAKAKEKKQLSEKNALISAIKDRGIKLLEEAKPQLSSSDSEDDCDTGSSSRSELGSQEATGAQVYLDEQGTLHWPVLFMYPEHQQTDFISAFCENSCFLDHIVVMFGEELPLWDTDRKYQPQNLQVFFEDNSSDRLYEVNPENTLLQILQHPRFFIKAGTPCFILLVKGSVFSKQFLTGKKVSKSK